MRFDATPYADVNDLIGDLLSRLRAILGDRLLSVTLFGSLVTGDFDPEASDIDLLVVTSSELRDEDLGSLRAAHAALGRNHPPWNDRVETAYFSVKALKLLESLNDQSVPVAIVSPGEPFHVTEAGHNWLINAFVIRRHGITLAGQPASEFIPPISRAEFTAAVRAQAAEWHDWVVHSRERKGQAYAILTLCRALHAFRTGEQVSKKQAARWAQVELPDWSGLIGSAIQWRAAWREEGVDHAATYEETVRFVRHVCAVITERM